MNILIVEDESLYAEQLQIIVENLNHNVCGIAESAEDALNLFGLQNPDMALIDINLKGEIDGLELGKWFSRYKKTIIIYITSFHEKEYFERAKQIAAFAFLKKPINEETLSRSIELAFEYEKKNNLFNLYQNTVDNNSLLIKQKSKYIKVHQEDITHISADDKYCTIFTGNDKKYIERITLKELNLKLNPKYFAQSHRSYIVNLKNTQEVNTADLTIKVKNYVLPLGNTYKEYFLKKFGI